MWENPPLRLKLNHNEIHIWLININNFTQDIAFFSQLLSPDELLRTKKYKGEHLQHNFIINRGFLRVILAKYLSINGKQIKFIYNQKGKPYLSDNSQSNIQFNLSHKNQYTIYAISQDNLGIDIEIIKPNIEVENIAQRFFTKEEFNYISQLQKAERLEYFFQLWTAKEAYLKSIGEGLSGGLNSINLWKKNNLQNWQIEIDNLSLEENRLWQIITFKAIDHYWASLAIKQPHDLNIKYYLIDSLVTN
jgi:4'-phosphopantetheinyl transferase